MELAFFIFLFWAVYSYLIFPAILWSLQVFWRNPWQKGGEKLPSVSLIISAYNEEAVIDAKLKNALALDYPKDRLEVIVASDGSSDRTNELVSAVPDARLKLRAFAERSGKTACLNRVVPGARGEIVVFTDANSMFPRDLLLKLVSNFADDAVGCVTGWTKYISAAGGQDITGLYARLEKWIKIQESRISSCVGADGAVFGIRKAFFRRLEDRDINDFVIPLDVVGQGRRIVLDPAVFCCEDASDSDDKAYRRQVRISNRTLSAIRRRLHFVNIGRYGTFSFFLLSHKLVRLLAPVFFLAALAINLFLLKISFVYLVSLAALLGFVGLGTAGLAGLGSGRIVSVCKLFLLTLAAQLMGCLRLVLGIEDRLWKPER